MSIEKNIGNRSSQVKPYNCHSLHKSVMEIFHFLDLEPISAPRSTYPSQIIADRRTMVPRRVDAGVIIFRQTDFQIFRPKVQTLIITS